MVPNCILITVMLFFICVTCQIHYCNFTMVMCTSLPHKEDSGPWFRQEVPRNLWTPNVHYFRAQYDPAASSVSNINGNRGITCEGKGGRCVGLTAFSSSYGDFLAFDLLEVISLNFLGGTEEDTKNFLGTHNRAEKRTEVPQVPQRYCCTSTFIYHWWQWKVACGQIEENISLCQIGFLNFKRRAICV